MFNLPSEKENLLRILSIRMNFTCRDIHPREQSVCISDLLAGKETKKTAGTPFRDEMVILDGFPHQDLNYILNEMIRTGNTISLKAVTTPTNTRWTPAILHMHLVSENMRMNSFSPEKKA